jgi:hypothetical protein
MSGSSIGLVISLPFFFYVIISYTAPLVMGLPIKRKCEWSIPHFLLLNDLPPLRTGADLRKEGDRGGEIIIAGPFQMRG